MTGLGLNIPGASWSAGNVIGSVYPLPSIAQLATYGNAGATPILGLTPSVIGSPILSPNYFTGSGNGGGYDTGIPDVATKTMMLLCSPAASGRSTGMGDYQGSGVTPNGDWFLFDAGNGALRATASTATATSQSALTTAIFDGKFYLCFADFSATQVTVSCYKGGTLLKGATQSLASRGVAAVNIRVARDYTTSDANNVNANINIAASGLWPGVNLTDAQKLQMYNVMVSLFSSKLTLG
ncbi:UNVERIFIED_ORG: hypothetical protein M2414_002347 [Rahnella aquatilis]